MDKEVIILSIQSEWANLILQEVKIEEIRKTIPNRKLPIDVYLYVTKDHPRRLIFDNRLQMYRTINYKDLIKTDIVLNGKIIAKFTLESTQELDMENINQTNLDNSCLTIEQLKNYVGEKQKVYAWNIVNLKAISPRELNSFYAFEEYELKKAPQSWCYAYKDPQPNIFRKD